MEMIEVTRGTTHRIEAFFSDGAGAGVTGLTATLRIRRKSDGYYMDNVGAFTAAVPGSEPALAAVDATNLPGVYYFDFTVPDSDDVYLIRGDGSASAANRYQFGEIKTKNVSDAALGKAARFIANRKDQEITGANLARVSVYDDAGSNVVDQYDIFVDDPATVRQILPV